MYNFSKKQKIIIGIILAILVIIMLGYVYSKGSEKSEESFETTLSMEQENTSSVEDDISENTDEQIIVHVAGAVNNEGIVYLKEGARINEAIEKAGGTTAEADMSQINLAYELEDGMKIYIPKKGEIMEENEDQDYLVKFNTVDPTTSNNTNGEVSTNETSIKTSSKININKAGQSELETLPGIGESTAQKIIAHREENGKFKTIEDIKEVSGIGDAKYEKIKNNITV